MGGTAQFPAQPDQIQAMLAQLQQQPANPAPATSGFASDTSNPTAMPISSPTTPGSTGDLENSAAQVPQQLGQALQNQQQPDKPPQAWSPGNPYAQQAQDFSQKFAASQPVPGGGVKKMLSNFFQGMGGSMMHEAGLQTPDEKRQQLLHNATTYGNLASNWEELQSMQKYRAALTERQGQENDFAARMQPLRLQQEQQTLQAGQQSLEAGQQGIPTVRPSMSAADLNELGVPGDLAAQYAGKPLSAADFGAVKAMATAGQKQIYDYGADGQGQGKGVWLVDKQFNPIKQLSSISETSRSTGLAKQQMQLQLQQAQAGQTGVDIVEGRLDPSQISPRSPQYPFVLNAANQYSQSQYGQPFDFAKASSDYGYAKNATTQNTLKMINGMTEPGGAIEIAQKAASALPQLDSSLVNKVFNATATQFGSAEATNFHTAMLGLADEYSKVMGGGTGSDTGRQQGLDLLKAAYSKNQLSGAIGIMQKDIGARKNAIVGNNTYLKRQYSPQAAGAASATQPAGTAGFSWSSFPTVQQ